MKRSIRMGLTALLVPVLGLAAAGCDDDPFALPWAEDPGQNTLYSLDRPELNRPSAFNMFERTEVVIEGPYSEGRWDFAVDRRDGEFVLLPPRVLGVTSRAALVPVGGPGGYDDPLMAPADTAFYIMNEPVPMELGRTYIVRTHEQLDGFGRVCHFFGWLEPVSMNHEAGTFTFRHDTSPNCNNRRLVPPGR